MSNPSNTRDLLLQIAEPVCASAGYDLVEIHYVREQGGWIVRVFIDAIPVVDAQTGSTEDSGVRFEDCERVSRELSAVLDVEDVVPQAYRLEVSSPGVARPLRTIAHFRRFAGERAKISLHQGVATDSGPSGPRRNFTGTIIETQTIVETQTDDSDSAENAALVIIDVDGTQFELPLSDISSAKLLPDWDALSARNSASSNTATNAPNSPNNHGVA